MKLISSVLERKRENSTCALIPFITAGYPSIDLTIQALFMLEKQGADIIELGIPYVDSLADGQLIQQASSIAISNGVYIDQVLYILRQIKLKINTPIVIFTYYNPILVRGLSKFVKEISDLNVKGLIIPDLPIEETAYVSKICSCVNLELILFVAPTSSTSRIKEIVLRSHGCIYLVSSTGVTGIRDSINSNICQVSNYVTNETDKLVMLGFGISSPDQVYNLLSLNCKIDGIVVGSAFTRILSDHVAKSSASVISEVGAFCKQMKLAATNRSKNIS